MRINEELTVFHSEVLNNLNCVHGALLRMNRSIQAEGVFGGIKWNREYKRLRRRGMEGVILELGLISCGFNLHKFYLMRTEQRESPCKPRLSGLLCGVQVQGFCGKAAKTLAHFTRALRCSCENTHCLHV